MNVFVGESQQTGGKHGIQCILQVSHHIIWVQCVVDTQ